ncbi:MAG: hypothetical protein OHK0039_36460 [Bacteroidia bacterium]
MSAQSLVPVLRDPRAVVRETALSQLVDGYSIRTATHRYTRWEDGGQELYDLLRDRGEMHNLAGDARHADRLRQLDALLSARVAAANAAPPGLTVVRP